MRLKSYAHSSMTQWTYNAYLFAVNIKIDRSYAFAIVLNVNFPCGFEIVAFVAVNSLTWSSLSKASAVYCFIGRRPPDSCWPRHLQALSFRSDYVGPDPKSNAPPLVQPADGRFADAGSITGCVLHRLCVLSARAAGLCGRCRPPHPQPSHFRPSLLLPLRGWPWRCCFSPSSSHRCLLPLSKLRWWHCSDTETTCSMSCKFFISQISTHVAGSSHQLKNQRVVIWRHAWLTPWVSNLVTT